MKKFYLKGKILLGATAAAAVLASGCGDSENFVFTGTGTGTVPGGVPVTPVLPAPPVAVDDSFRALGNATVSYTAANGVLTNDTVNGADISSFDAAGSQGGTLTLNNDGSFSYTPVFGFVGSETFNYTLTNIDGDSTATITLTSSGSGFFVNNQGGTTGDGSQAQPFDTLAEAVAAAGNGDTIFVSRGDGSSVGLSDDITLPQGVDLIGEGQGLVLSQTVVPQGQAPVIDATVTVSGDNTISGFTFEDGDEAIVGNAFTDVTITNNTFQDGSVSEQQIDLTDVLGTVTITGNTFLQPDFTASIDLATTGVCTLNVSSNTFGLASGSTGGDDCTEISVGNGGNATIQWNNNTMTGVNTATASLEAGLDLDLTFDGQATLTATGNMSSFLEQSALQIETFGAATLTATVSGNAFDQQISTIQPEIDVQVFEFSDATVVFDNNSITGSADRGFAFVAVEMSSLNIALRNNSITGTAADAVQIDAFDSSTICAEITGNTFGADLDFFEDTMNNLRVEQFGNAMGDVLETLNTFTSGGVDVSFGAVTSVADGACAIP